MRVCLLSIAALLMAMPGPGFAEDRAGREAVRWRAFRLAEVAHELARSGQRWRQLLDVPSMTVGVYRLPARAEDAQSPHAQDEVYYVTEGRARLRAAGGSQPVGPGSVAFVRANVPHRFEKIERDLWTVVVFTRSSPEKRVAARVLDRAVTEAGRKADENVWNPFLQLPTLRFGLYMLPKTLGADRTLVHQADEVNVVVRGSGRLTMGDDTIDVASGSIVWVAAGVGHHFHDLGGDLDVLILFAPK